MGNLQIKNVPVELHEALAERARARGLTMSQYVLRLLERDLSGPTMEEWLDGLAADWTARTGTRSADVDTVHVLDEVRLELGDHGARKAFGAEATSTARHGLPG